MDENGKRDRIKDTIVTNPTRDELLTSLGFDKSEVNVDSAIADSFIFAPQVKQVL